MRKLLLKALDIEPQELGPVSLLLTISFFIGVFLVTFDVGTSALFMDTSRGYGQSHLPKAFIVSGLLGALVSFIFVTIQKRTSFSFLVKSTFIFIFIYIAVLSAVLEATKGGDPLIFRDVIFFSFASLGPLNALGILSFYGIVTRSFNLKNQKRLTGTVDQGQMFATAIAFFTVPVLDSTFIYFSQDVIHYLYVSFMAVIGAVMLFFLYEKKYPVAELVKHAVIDKNEVVARVETFINNRYIRLISIIVLLSGISAIFVDYSFLSLASKNYDNDPNGFANFLAYFGGSLTVFSLLLQIFAGDRIIETYGVKISLLILPVLLAAFTIVSSLIGTVRGINEMAFIVFIGLCKFFFQACRESFEEPIFKGFFLPVEKNIRHDVQAKIEGGFNQISVLLAGAILISLGILPFFELIHYTYFLVFIFLGYGYVVLMLHDQYQKTLKDTLASQKGKNSVSRNEYSVTEALSDELKSNHHERVIYSLKLMEKMEPVLFESVLIGFATDQNPKVRQYAIQRIHELKLISAVQSVRKMTETEDSPVVKKLAQDALKYIDQTENVPLGGPKLAQLVRSRNPEDREFAAKILSRANDDQSILHLLLLMRDPNPSVRLTAIISAGKCRNQELWPLLIESLSSSVFGSAAASALATIGSPVMHSLETAFHKSGQTHQTQLRIVQVYGKIGGQQAVEHLWSKLDFPAKKIRNQVLLSLSNCGFRVNDETLVRIKQTLETAIGNAAWNVAALSEVSKEEIHKPIREALEEEIRNDNDQIFLLLSFLYDAQSIRLVKENLESGTVEGKLYGIELLDVFLEDDLQPLLFPLLEDISQEERTEKLQNFFPRESLDPVTVLIHIVNRDYNYINRWTKACAIYALAGMAEYKVTDDLLANLFNPDPLIRQTSAWVIWQLDRDSYLSCAQRLSAGIRKELDDIIMHPEKKAELRIEKILKLKEVPAFHQVAGVILADLEEIIEPVVFTRDKTIISNKDNGSSPFYILTEGEAGIFENGQLLSSLKGNEILGELLILDTDYYAYEVRALERVQAFKIEKSKFFELMINNYELSREFVQVIGSRWTEVNNDPYKAKT